MTTSETLLLIQTIVFFLTGIVVLWYTFETYRIRKETQIQNSHLAEQLLMMKEKEKFELHKEISFVEPVFKPEYSNVGKNNGTCNLVNNGGSIKNISVQPIEVFSISITPRNFLNSGEKGKIAIQKYPEPIPNFLHFKIRFTNKLGIEREKLFKYSTKNAMFEEVDKI